MTEGAITTSLQEVRPGVLGPTTDSSLVDSEADVYGEALIINAALM